MARQVQRRARKDYPPSIKAGDLYWFAQIKTGQRSSRIIRSLTRIPESQMTTSPFKSGWAAAEEDWNASEQGGDAMRSAAEAIRGLGEECQGSLDNMPEGLQQGSTGELLTERVSACEEAADQLDTLADEFDGLDEVEDPGEGPDADDYVDGGFEEAEEAHTEAKEAFEEYESERDRIVSEANDLIGRMPD